MVLSEKRCDDDDDDDNDDEEEEEYEFVDCFGYHEWWCEAIHSAIIRQGDGLGFNKKFL